MQPSERWGAMAANTHEFLQQERHGLVDRKEIYKKNQKNLKQ
jgi:hypothetical protein